MLHAKFLLAILKPEDVSLPQDYLDRFPYWNLKDMEDDIFFKFEYFDPNWSKEIPSYITHVAFDPKTRLTYIKCDPVRD